jgi:hypothetical protein
MDGPQPHYSCADSPPRNEAGTADAMINKPFARFYIMRDSTYQGQPEKGKAICDPFKAKRATFPARSLECHVTFYFVYMLLSFYALASHRAKVSEKPFEFA